MSSKRHMRRKACEGKRRHASQAEAIEHIVSLNRSGGRRPGPLDTYRCEFCGGYHIGHRRGTSGFNRGRRP